MHWEGYLLNIFISNTNDSFTVNKDTGLILRRYSDSINFLYLSYGGNFVVKKVFVRQSKMIFDDIGKCMKDGSVKCYDILKRDEEMDKVFKATKVTDKLNDPAANIVQNRIHQMVESHPELAEELTKLENELLELHKK